jgi:hypothetical protein
MRTTSPAPTGDRRISLRRRLAPLFVLFLLAVAACDDASPTSPQGRLALPGVLRGTVTLLGDVGPTHPPGTISLYGSLSELGQWMPQRSAQLIRRDGINRVYEFVVPGVAAGTYYVRFCWTIACGEYRNPVTGELRTVRIVPGRTTRLSFGL